LEPQPKFASFLLIIIILEIIILFLQDNYGPRFFIPKRFRKGYYNYYKSINELKNTTKYSDIDNASCAICLGDLVINKNDPINITKIDNESLLASTTIENVINMDEINVNKRKCFKRVKHNNKYNNKLMVTPCHHVFHIDCLKSWRELKDECPVCRTTNPQIED
jgi:hypothetical protein